MIYQIFEDPYVEVVHDTCEFHKENPKQANYAGCTCSASYILKVKKFRPNPDVGDRIK